MGHEGLTLWDWLWLSWLGYFAALEVYAIWSPRLDDTFSEFCWRWFGVRPPSWVDEGLTPWMPRLRKLRRFLMFAILGWLTLHMMSGGRLM